MQGTLPSAQKKPAGALCAVLPVLLVLLVLAQQVCAGPLVRSGPEQPALPVLRRTARMSPLWRIMNSKPHGAYCQSNYECSSGLCRNGHCSNNQHASWETVNH